MAMVLAGIWSSSLLAAEPPPGPRFPESSWSEELKGKLEDGPAILARDLDIPIADPPGPLSPITARELHYLRQLVGARTPAQETLIRAEADDPSLYFLTNFGFDPEDYPATVRLIEATLHDVGYFILREKWRLQRARPIQLDPLLPLVIPTPPHSAYPSGHGGVAWAEALVLGRLAPQYAPAWLRYAQAIGHRRELAGVHYPSDTRAGQALGAYVVEQLLQTEEFQALMAEAATEWPPASRSTQPRLREMSGNLGR